MLDLEGTTLKRAKNEEDVHVPADAAKDWKETDDVSSQIETGGSSTLIRLPVHQPRWLARGQLLLRDWDEKNPATPHVHVPLPVYDRSFILPQGEHFDLSLPALTLTPEEMAYFAIQAQTNPGRKTPSVDWDNMTQEKMGYIAGQFEGDGTVIVEKVDIRAEAKGGNTGQLILRVEKSENAYDILYVLQILCGGKIYKGKKEKGNQQATRHWKLAGYPALDLIKNLLAYTTSKRNQYRVAGEYPLGINLAKPSCKPKPLAVFDPRTDPEKTSTPRWVFRYFSQLSAQNDGHSGIMRFLGGEIKAVCNGKQWVCFSFSRVYALVLIIIQVLTGFCTWPIPSLMRWLLHASTACATSSRC